MALTGKLAADFAPFYDAVQKADEHLTDMAAGADKVSARLNAMQDSFSGRAIIQDATVMTEAIERAGGASVLTASEMARVNAKVSEAIEKYAALGQQAPAALHVLEAQTRKIEAPTEGLSTKMIALGTAIGTMAANAVTALGKLAIEGIGRLVTGLGDLALSGAGVADVEENFERLTAQAGLLGGALLGTLRDGTHATVTNFELMKLVNQDLAAGMRLTDGQFATLAKGAFALAQATGTDVKSALDAMNDAMLTGRTRAVAMLTGKIDLEAAETKYAAALGVLRKDLIESEKLEAARIAILDSVSAATARLGEQTDGLDEKVAQAVTWWTNLKDKLGAAIATSPVLGAALDSVGKSLMAAFGGSQEKLVAAITAGINKFAIWVVDAGIYLVEFARIGVQAFNALQVPQKAVTAAMIYLVERFAAGIATMAELAAKLPGVGGAFDTVAASARAGATAWAAMREESSSSLTAALAAASGHGAVNAALDKLTGGLVNAKAAMVAATLATAQAKPVQEAFVEQTANQEGALRRAAAAQAAFEADFKKFNAQANQNLPILTGMMHNFEKKFPEVAIEVERLDMKFKSLTEADRLDPMIDKITTVTRATVAWSEAMSLVSQGLGTMTGTIHPDLSPEGRAATQKAWDEHRYYGPVVGGTPQNPRGTGPDFAALGYTARPASDTGSRILPNGRGDTNINAPIYISSVMGDPQEIGRRTKEGVVAAARATGQRLAEA